MLRIEGMTTNGVAEPIGIGAERPAFGWRHLADERGWKQSAYRLVVAEHADGAEAEHTVWDSGRVESGQSQHVVYGGPPLVSGRSYRWKVQVWDGAGADCGWSEGSRFETGLLTPEEWTAAWIADSARAEPEPEHDRLAGASVVWDAGGAGPSADGKAKRYFRLSVALPDKQPSWAKVETFAADALHLYVEGNDEGLYYPYLQAVTLDVSSLVGPGGCTIAGSSDGERAGFVAVLEIGYPDGETLRFGTDAGWKTTDAPGRDWMLPGYDDREWRPVATIGTFGQGDWETYKRILYPVNVGYGPCPSFGHTFHLARRVVRARLYASALGVYRASINGKPVGDDALAPGWTDYRIRIPYQTYDVTPLLRIGDNRIAAIVGPGWYAGHLGICGPYHYGTSVALRAELHLTYEDGTTEKIVSDPEWRAENSAVVASDIYMGEIYDARRAPAQPLRRRVVAPAGVPEGRMAAQEGPAIRPMRELAPRSIRNLGEGDWLADMGQNMTGWIRLALSGAAGTRVRIRYGERLGPDGRLYRANLRTAKQTDVYIAEGAEREVFEPLFTYHGFQYVEIEGYPGELEAEAIAGIAIHSELRSTGELVTNHALLNRFVENIGWSQRGNFIGIPLDCPQRDERLGWTGDAHMFARTASYLMDSSEFYRKWLQDIRDAQGENGAFPDVAPFVEHFGKGHVFFADGGVILPWAMYKMYGDRRYVVENYEAMRRYVDYLEQDGDERLVRRTVSFGDHLALGAATAPALMNVFLFAYSVSLMIEMAGIVGDAEGAERYRTLFGRLRRTFQEDYVNADGRISDGSQTAYVLALKIGLLSEEGRAIAARELAGDIASRGTHLTTGFMGAAYVLPVLSEIGEHALAGKLLLQESFPSWLYPVRQGATTIWERWDGWTEEAGFQDPEMNSFNHYALGSVGEWLYRYVAGIDIPEGEYGFRRLALRPRPIEGLTTLRCRYDSPYGTIVSRWEADDNGDFAWDVEIPANASAMAIVPAASEDEVRLDGQPVDATGSPAAGTGWTLEGRDAETVRFELGSGSYRFLVRSKVR